MEYESWSWWQRRSRKWQSAAVGLSEEWWRVAAPVTEVTVSERGGIARIGVVVTAPVTVTEVAVSGGGIVGGVVAALVTEVVVSERCGIAGIGVVVTAPVTEVAVSGGGIVGGVVVWTEALDEDEGVPPGHVIGRVQLPAGGRACMASAVPDGMKIARSTPGGVVAVRRLSSAMWL